MNFSPERICFMLTSSITAWLIMHAVQYLIIIGQKRWKKYLMFFSCYLLGNMVIFIGDTVNILATILCFLMITLLCCEGSLWKKITIGIMYASTIFSFNALRDNYLKPLGVMQPILRLAMPVYNLRRWEYLQMGWYAHSPFHEIISNAASLLFALFLYTGIRKFAPDRDYTLSDSLWKLLLLLTATPFGIVCSIVTLTPAHNKTILPSEQSVEHLILFIITLLSFISLLWCITVLAKQQKLENQNMFMEINRQYYKAMEQQHFEVRRLKHDLANHIQALTALPPDKRDSYLNGLALHTDSMPPLSYCGDSTVNAVLSVKKTIMDRCGIKIELSVEIPRELPFDKTDVCALYANALDNAMEACMKLDEKQRTVYLKSKAKKGLFCLEVSNPIPDSKEHEAKTIHDDNLSSKDIPPTSKADKMNHGFGLKSIHEIVSRYHGNLEIKTTDGIFDLFLYIHYL